jgi:hypothetical protein
MVQWTEKLRPCAEALYIVLFENHSQVGGIHYFFYNLPSINLLLLVLVLKLLYYFRLRDMCLCDLDFYF